MVRRRCPECGREIGDSAGCPSCKIELLTVRTKSRSPISKILSAEGARNEAVLLGVVLGIISLFLPYMGWSAYNGMGILDGGGSVSGIDFMASNDAVIVLGFIIFIASLALSLLKPVFGSFGLLGMWLLTLSEAPSYVVSRVPMEMLGNLIYTHWGIGYYLGWASVLIIITGLLVGKREVDSKRVEKGLERKYEYESFTKGHL